MPSNFSSRKRIREAMLAFKEAVYHPSVVSSWTLMIFLLPLLAHIHSSLYLPY